MARPVIVTTRRRWLLGASSLLATGCGAPVVAKPSPRRQRPIVVLGAGLAGLAAAHALRDAGADVVVLEAQRRVGGRILTIRAPLEEGLHVEAGAAHVQGDPALMALVARAGVSLDGARSRASRARQVAVVAGKRLRLGAGEELPRPRRFTADEEALGFQGRLRRTFGDVTRFDAEAPWPPPALARSDAQSGADLMSERGASPGYVQAFGAAMLGEPIERVSGAFVLREMAGFFRDVTLEGGGRIAGGTSRLPEALAAQLGARVWLGCEVKRIAWADDGARIAFERAGVLEQLDAERVVCAIPYSVLRHLDLAPAFSPAKMRAVHGLRMVSVARIFAQMDRRFWIERGESGDAETDLAIAKVRDETKLEPATAGVLGAYLSGDAARRLAALPEAERIRTFLEVAEQVHPGALRHAVADAALAKFWDDDPFARGAYAWFAPGEMTAFGGALATAEGSVHFAGDHTSHRPGWMHGAVASATRAVSEVLAARRA